MIPRVDWSRLPPARYTLAGGSVLQSALGIMTLSSYERGQTPSPWLSRPHRFLGYTLITLAMTQSLIGTWNLFSLPSRQKRKKHLIHALLSWGATLSYAYAGYLAWHARTDPDYGKYKTHRILALTATGATLLTIGAVIW